MNLECERAAARAADLRAGEPTPPELAAHVAGCAECQAVEAGADAVRGALDAWTVPEPPADLVERALARAALAAVHRDEPDLPTPTPAPSRPRRRTSVEILTSAVVVEGGAGEAPSRRRLILRLCSQAAAAAVLFGLCTAFVSVYYPVVVHAIEERRVHACQERLGALARAAARYRQERPDAPVLRGPELRQALIEGGYADRSDFVCPGPRGADLAELSYVGQLPRQGEDGAIDPERPIYWDRFGNHDSGFNVVYPDGRVELVSVDDFASFWGMERE